MNPRLVSALLALFFVGGCASNAPRTSRDSGLDVDADRSDAGSVDSGQPDTGVADTGVADTGAVDAGLADSGATDSAVVDSGVADSGRADTGTPDSGAVDSGVADSGAADAGLIDAGPPPTPTRGTYRYTRLPVGGLRDSHRVAFHPDGSYAVYLETSGVVHVYDWATGTDTPIDLDPPGSAILRLSDFDFDPSGDFGLLVGTRRDGSAETGVVYRFDDAAWRAGTMASVLVAQPSADRAGTRFMATAFPWEAGLPMVLAQSGSSPYVATIRRYDPAAGDFGSFISARPTSAGCEDLAFVNNEFGGEGVALVCGLNGADAPYWTNIGGVDEWRSGPTGTLGNTSRIAAHVGGDYALAIGNSSGRIHRFQDGAWVPSSSALWFRRFGIWGVGFQQDGRRALSVGRAGATPLRAAILEYRHDLYSLSEVTDVSIPNFDTAPWIGDSSVYLKDVAFHPGCDGGLIVGGKSDYRGSQGWLVEFAIEGGTSCHVR